MERNVIGTESLSKNLGQTAMANAKTSFSLT
jgi:hypothetical protein